MNSLDGRRRRWIALDVEFTTNPLGSRLRAEFGNEGPLVWIALLAAAKRSANEGMVSFGSDTDLWHLLGIDPPAFSSDDFLKVTGRMKETARRNRGQITDITLRRWGDLQQTIRRDVATDRQARSRARIRRDIDVTDSDSYRDNDQDSRSISAADVGFAVFGEVARAVIEPADIVEPEVIEEDTRHTPRGIPYADLVFRQWCQMEVAKRPNVRNQKAVADLKYIEDRAAFEAELDQGRLGRRWRIINEGQAGGLCDHTYDGRDMRDGDYCPRCKTHTEQEVAT